MKTVVLGVLALIAQSAVAFPATQATCAGQYGIIAGALRHYPPATSYCATKYPAKRHPCTTTVTAKASTSSVTIVKSTTITGPAVTAVVTVSGTTTIAAPAVTNTITASSSTTVTDIASSTTVTVSESITITPSPASTTTTSTTTSTEILDTSTVTETDTSTTTSTETATVTLPRAKNKRATLLDVTSDSTVSSINLASVPTDDPTLDNRGGLVARGDPRKAQWQSCLRKNNVVSTVCSCLATISTVTKTATPKPSLVSVTSFSTQQITPTVSSTSTALATQTSSPVESTTTTTVITQTITPEVSTEYTTTTLSETAPQDTITLTETSTDTVQTQPLTTVTVTSIVSTTITTTTSVTPTFTPLAAGVNALKNPSFEDFTASGPTGTINDWPNTAGGRLYPNRFQPAALDGDTYAILNYAGNIANPAPIMTQTLNDLAIGRTYTLTFSYDLHSIVAVSSCVLSVTLGDAVLYTRTLTAADDPRPYNWKGPETVTYVPTSRDTTLNFGYTCSPSGVQSDAVSYIFLDKLFFTYA